MSAESIVQAVSEHLFSEEGANVFAVLDGASIPTLLMSLHDRQPEYVCLYRGELEPDLAEVAPYLVQLEAGSDFAAWVVEKGWGKHWGIFAISFADLRAMRHHLRTFLTVYDSDGQPILFRYYDPRVLSLYLPTCNAEELATVFGPVTSYVIESDDPNIVLRFGLESGALVQQKIPLE
jgi:hypothetical protein